MSTLRSAVVAAAAAAAALGLASRWVGLAATGPVVARGKDGGAAAGGEEGMIRPPAIAPGARRDAGETPLQGPGRGRERAWGKAVEGQALSIATEKATYAVGEEISLDFRLKNVGRVDVGPPGVPYPDLLSSLSVTRPNGKAAALTPEGERTLHPDPLAPPPAGSMAPPPMGVLAPGAEDESLFLITLYYDLRRPGVYVASVKARVLKAGGGLSSAEAVSNKLQITVADVAGERLRQLAERSPGDQYLPVDLDTRYITDAGLRYLAGMTRVRSVELRNAKNISDAGLEHLKGLASLQMLSLDDTAVTDAGLEHLKGLASLQMLSLDGTAVTDAGLQSLGGLRGLSLLDLSRTRITGLGLRHLNRLTRLQVLNLADTEVADAGLAELKPLARLRELGLARTGVGDAGLGGVGGLRELRRLDLNETRITDTGLQQLAGLAELQRLSIRGTRVTDAGLGHLKRLTKLEELSLGGTRITGAGLRSIEPLASLRSLDLGGIQLTNAELGRLRAFRELRLLWLGKAQTGRFPALDGGLVGWDAASVTREGVRRLQEALPNCAISGVGEAADQPRDRR